MPPAQIRVIATPNGGGFGGKSDPFNHEIVVANLSRVTGRPVKICLTREEVFYCHRGRHPVLMKVRTGVKKDGAITAMHFQTVLDGGAYGSYGVASTYYTGALQTVTYQVPAYRFDGARVFTNKPPCGPKRGHGTPQPRFALEVQLDKIACDLGIDPAEIRRRHLHPANTLTANYLRVGTIGLGACIDKVVAASGWKKRRGKLPPGRGLGLACSSYLCGAGLPIYWNTMPQSGVQLKLDRGGGVTVFCGSTDIGQGSDSILASIVAEVLGIDPFDIRDRHRRHGPDAGGPRLVLLARDADDRQRRDPGGRARERDARRDRGAEARDPAGGRGLRRGTRLRRGEPRKGHELRRGGGPRRVALRHPGHRRFVHAAALRRPLPRRGCGPVARVLVLRRGRRGRGRPGDRDPDDRRRSGSRTTSASASIRCSSWGRSRAPSTWGSARP